MSNKNRRAIPASERGDQRSNEETTYTEKNVGYYIPLLKAVDEAQEVTGIVLQPGVVDAQGDIISEEVILKAAQKFLAQYNKSTELGEQHKVFKQQFDLLQSYVAPTDMAINGKAIKKGTWLVVVKVKNSKDWQKVKEGKITGFSVGGTAKVKQLKK